MPCSSMRNPREGIVLTARPFIEQNTARLKKSMKPTGTLPYDLLDEGCQAMARLVPLFVLVLTLLATRPAHACVCIVGIPACQSVWEADAVFLARVIDATRVSTGHHGTVVREGVSNVTVLLTS
jgi:hypothetical protein